MGAMSSISARKCWHFVYEVLSCGVYKAWIRHSMVSQLCVSEACGSGMQPFACMVACIKSQQNRAECLNI